MVLILTLMYIFQVLFVSINSDEEDHQRIIEFFGMKKDEIPAMRLIRLEEDMAKYKPQKPELTKDNIKSFVQDFIDGKLKVSNDWDVKITVLWNVVPALEMEAAHPSKTLVTVYEKTAVLAVTCVRISQRFYHMSILRLVFSCCSTFYGLS